MSLKGWSSASVIMRGMVINMEEAKLGTLAQIKAIIDSRADGNLLLFKKSK